MAHDVFVSYSHVDKPVADAAVAALERRGIRCWIAPRDIIPGVDWSEAIIEALDACRVMLLVFSQHANESQQVKREVERAVAKGVPVMPLRIQDVPLAKSLEYFISMPHWIDALTPERQRDLDYLAETVGLLLARQGRAPDAPPRPAPAPARATSTSRTPFIVGGGVALLAAIAAAVVLLRPKPPGPEPEPLPAPTPRAEDAGTSGPTGAPAPRREAAQGVVDPRLVGAWRATVNAKGVTTEQRFRVEPSGAYAWVMVLADDGTLGAGGGNILQASRRYGTFGQAYAFRGADVVTVTGPAGTADWHRVGASRGGSATLDPALSGHWETRTTDPEGRTWSSTWEIAATGAYQFRSMANEAGRIETSGSRWTARPEARPVRHGSLTFSGPNEMRMRDDGGDEATWTREGS